MDHSLAEAHIQTAKQNLCTARDAEFGRTVRVGR